MSRPQFSQPQQQMTASHSTVNGGLIDFQENYGRTMCEYPTPQQIMAAAAGYPPQGVYMPGMPQPAVLAAGYQASQVPYHQAANGYPVPVNQQAVAAAQTVVQPAHVGTPTTTTASPAPGTYISGPPMFLHAYGKTYKPVDDVGGETSAPGVVTKQTPSSSSKGKPTIAANECDPATTKMLTESDLHQAIDQRVQSKVESYLSSRRQPVPSHHSGIASRPSGLAVSRNHYSGRPSGMSAEERAAMRVQSVNATMRGSSTGGPRGSVREPSHISRDW
jgi:hypothetical protein